jgi:hypothetical protein
MSKDIEKMTNDEWIDYREELLQEFLKKGGTLIPNPECCMCDAHEGYTCLEDEIFQLAQEGIE